MITMRSQLAVVSGLYLVNAAIGTWLAVRDDLPGRPFGWSTGLTPLSDFLFGLGTALSAPLVLLLLLAGLNLLVLRGNAVGRWATTAIVVLGFGFLIGAVAEPGTWEFLSVGSISPLIATVLIANVMLPIAMVIVASRIRSMA